MRCYVISLGRRPDRLAELLRQWPNSLPAPTVVPAVDGHRLPRLRGWDAGAWGCRASHIRVLEDALCRGEQLVYVFEDDARFAGTFTPDVPEGSAIHLFGGLHRPGGVVLNTHAYAATAAGQAALYVAAVESVRDGHVDVAFQRAYRRVPFSVSSPWTVIQSGSPSDIHHNSFPRSGGR